MRAASPRSRDHGGSWSRFLGNDGLGLCCRRWWAERPGHNPHVPPRLWPCFQKVEPRRGSRSSPCAGHPLTKEFRLAHSSSASTRVCWCLGSGPALLGVWMPFDAIGPDGALSRHIECRVVWSRRATGERWIGRSGLVRGWRHRRGGRNRGFDKHRGIRGRAARSSTRVYLARRSFDLEAHPWNAGGPLHAVGGRSEETAVSEARMGDLRDGLRACQPDCSIS